MKLRNLFLLLFAAIFAFSACDNTDNPVNPAEKPQPPTDLQATSKSSSSILLKWTASASETSTDFKEYELRITGGANPIQPIPINKGITSVEVGNLDEGTVYTFSIYGKFNDGTVSETAAQIQWSPRLDLHAIKIMN